MDPVTGMALLLTAQTGLTGAGMAASRQQAKADKQRIKTEAAVARERNAAESLQAARNFRQSLSSQLAIASLRSMGGGSIVRQFGAQAMGTSYRDEEEFARRERLIGVQEKFGIAGAKTSSMARQAQGIGQLLQSGVSAISLSSSGPGGAKGEGA